MKKIAVLGGGESGTGAAILGKRKGFEVFLSDCGKINTKYKNVLLHNDIEWEEGQHTEKIILSASEVVKSPGIDDNTEIIRKIKSKKIPIISEIEFASRFSKAILIGITGTNGKTTTSSLVYDIFKEAGKDVCLAGNVGKSFAMELSDRDYRYFVLELSSFQLEGMYETRINDAVLLNITPDHLDRYDYKMENYIGAKMRIIRNQQKDDALVYCKDDEVLGEILPVTQIKSELLPYSITDDLCKGALLMNKKMKIKYKTEFNMNIEELSIKGKHNVYNSMAAALVAKRHDIRNTKIKESLANYINVEHRLEFVARVRGVDYINDSKATNINATWYALESFKRKIIWIAGGIDKGNDYNKLLPLVSEKVRHIICLGIDNTHIIDTFNKEFEFIYETNTMVEAVELAYKLSQPGDTVLLSPACASFDLFVNYEDRGNQFKEIVKNL